MKFGKALARIAETSVIEWLPFWIDYRLLKKKIKLMIREREQEPGQGRGVAEGPAGGEGGPRATTAEAMAQCSSEVEFFRLMDLEVRKGNAFFTNVEQQFLLRMRCIQDGLRMTQQLLHNRAADLPATFTAANRDEMWTRLVRACVSVYAEVLLLENYTIMSYCGFSKILKKHDRRTGFVCRERYMRYVLQKQPFAQYLRLLTMLREVDSLFRNVASRLPDSAQRRRYEAYIESTRQFAAGASQEYVYHAEGLLRQHVNVTGAPPPSAAAAAAAPAAAAAAAGASPQWQQQRGAAPGAWESQAAGAGEGNEGSALSRSARLPAAADSSSPRSVAAAAAAFSAVASISAGVGGVESQSSGGGAGKGGGGAHGFGFARTTDEAESGGSTSRGAHTSSSDEGGERLASSGRGSSFGTGSGGSGGSGGKGAGKLAKARAAARGATTATTPPAAVPAGTGGGALKPLRSEGEAPGGRAVSQAAVAQEEGEGSKEWSVSGGVSGGKRPAGGSAGGGYGGGGSSGGQATTPPPSSGGGPQQERSPPRKRRAATDDGGGSEA